MRASDVSTPEDQTEAKIPSQPPLLMIVNSDAAAEEIAALVAVFTSLGGSEPPAPRRTPEWSAHHRKVRTRLPHGPGGWRSSGLPR